MVWDSLGQMRAVEYYKDGMADSTWSQYDAAQNLIASFSYRALKKSELKLMNDLKTVQEKAKPNDPVFTIGAPRNVYIRDSLQPYQTQINMFYEAIASQPVQANLVGPFKYVQPDGAILQGAFDYNVPRGFWEIILRRELVFMIAFNQGVANVACNYDQLKSGEVVFKSIQVMPKPPYDLEKFVMKNISYPKEAHDKEQTGRIYVKFIVTETGAIDPNSVTCIRGENQKLNEEAVRVIKLLPPWIPGEHYGRKVNCEFVVPVNFQIRERL